MGLGLGLGLGMRNKLAFGGSSFLSESKSLFSRATIQPDSGRKTLINTCIKSLKDAGYWDRLDVLQVYAAHDEQFALLDWKRELVSAAKISTPTFTIDRGFLGTGGKALDSNFNPSTQGINFVQNRFSVAAYSRTNSTTSVNAQRDFGHVNLTTGLTMRARNTSDQLTVIPYSAGLTAYSSTAGTVTDSRGLFSVARSASNALLSRRNGTQLVTSAIVSAPPISSNIYVGSYNNNGVISASSNGREFAYFYAGDYFNGTEELAIFTIFETYLSAIGAGFFFDIRMNFNTLLNFATQL